MGTLKLKNVTFKYDGMSDNIFSELNLAIDESWKLGLIGRNGRGKTTLFKILLGQLEYHGTIETNLSFEHFPARVEHPTKDVQTVLLEIAKIDIAELWRIQIEMDQLGLNDDILSRQFDELSPGQRTKLLLAASFSQVDKFILLDEPTNHLDTAGRQTVINYLKGKTGFIVISHDREFLNQIIDHVVSIDRTAVKLINGNYDDWKVDFDQTNLREQKQNDKLNNEVKRLQDSANRTKQWAKNAEKGKNKSSHQDQQVNLDKGFIGHQAAKVMKKAQNTVKRTEAGIEQKKSLLKNLEVVNDLTMNYQPVKKRVLTVSELQVQRDQMDILNTELTFELLSGQRLILRGRNGSGKSTVLTTLINEPELITNGSIQWTAGIKVSYVSQMFDNLHGSLQNYTESYGIELSQMLNLLRKMGFERSTFTVELQNMSMGQQRKISLARSLCEQANIYVWDEPFNYLDIISREEIETAILKFQPTMLIVDHDKMFTQRVGTDFINL